MTGGPDPASTAGGPDLASTAGGPDLASTAGGPAPFLAGLPEALLVPLLDAAAEALRQLAPADVPASARKLRSFDRRGLATPAARSQLRRLLETEEGLRQPAVVRLLRRPEVVALLEEWAAVAGDAAQALTCVTEATAADRLPLLASALAAGRPPGSDLGLGLAVGAFSAGGREAGVAAEAKALEARVASVEEARRRVDQGRSMAESEVSRLGKELREERRNRRVREQQTSEELEDARRRVEELEGALAESGKLLEEAERGLAGAVERAARAAAQRAPARPPPAPPPEPREPPVDRVALAAAAETATQLAGSLRRLLAEPSAASASESSTSDFASAAGGPDFASAAGGPDFASAAGGPARRPPVPAGSGRSAGRAKVHIPPGLRHDAPEAAAAIVRTPGVVVVVDGYNVSMLAWPGVRPAEQRERLVDALAEFHLRLRCPVTVVFDGATVEGVRPPRRPGLQVVFSAAGQEADEVVIAQAAARPLSVPVVVVSSDGWVRARADAEGAEVLPSDAFLTLLGR